MVKRFLAPTNDTCDMDSYQMVVLASDYATLEAENAKLRAELERRVPDEPTQEEKDAAANRYLASVKAAPSAPKADDPVKVQAERWKAVCGDWQDTTLSIHGERTGYIACGIPEKAALALIDAHNAALPAAIAAARKGEGE